MIRRFVFLEDLNRFADLGSLALRALTGGFLVYGVMDNVLSAARMQEFADFLSANGFAAPQLMAPLSVYAQLLCGVAFVLGLLTRWAGLVTMINFIVAVAMVHASEDFRAWWPAIVLVAIGFHFAVAGAGKWSVDRMLGRA